MAKKPLSENKCTDLDKDLEWVENFNPSIISILYSMESHVRALDNIWQQHSSNLFKLKQNHCQGIISLSELETQEKLSLETYNTKKAEIFHEFFRQKGKNSQNKKKNNEDHILKNMNQYMGYNIGMEKISYPISEIKLESNRFDSESMDESCESLSTYNSTSLSTSTSYDENISRLDSKSDDSCHLIIAEICNNDKKKLTKGATRRIQYPMSFKVQVVEEYDRIIRLGGISNVQEKVAISMDVSQSLVSKWVKARDQLQVVKETSEVIIRNRKKREYNHIQSHSYNRSQQRSLSNIIGYNSSSTQRESLLELIRGSQLIERENSIIFNELSKRIKLFESTTAMSDSSLSDMTSDEESTTSD